MAGKLERNTPEWDRNYALVHIREAEAEHTRTEGFPVVMNDEQRRVLLGIKSDWDAGRIGAALRALRAN